MSLTRSQFHILKLLSLHGQHQLREVAELLGVSPPAATKNVDKLEQFGLVIRSASKGDRRATLLSISPEGRRLVWEYEQAKAARLAMLLIRFRPDEIEQLCRLLERFAMPLLAREGSGRGCSLRCAAYFARDCPIGHVRGDCPFRRTRGVAWTANGDDDSTTDRPPGPAG